MLPCIGLHEMQPIACTSALTRLVCAELLATYADANQEELPPLEQEISDAEDPSSGSGRDEEVDRQAHSADCVTSISVAPTQGKRHNYC